MAAQREWFEKDYYKVLGVVPTASEKEINAPTGSWRRRTTRTPTPARRSVKEISAAYDVIGDAEKRKEYDEVRAHGPVGGFGGVPGGGGGGTFRMEDMGDLGDLFGGLFGGGAGRTRTNPRGPQRGADMEAQLHLSLQDTVHGVATFVNVPQEVRCSNCRGNGAAPGTSDGAACPRCGGTGSLNDNQGLFSLSTVCPDCMGRGTLFDTPCPVCHDGQEHKVRSVKVRIPAGVEGGQRIRVKGRGAPGQGMAPAGSPTWSSTWPGTTSSGAAGAT